METAGSAHRSVQAKPIYTPQGPETRVTSVLKHGEVRKIQYLASNRFAGVHMISRIINLESFIYDNPGVG